MPKKDNSYNDDFDGDNSDDSTDLDPVHISDEEESARDDYLDGLGKAVEQVQEELEKELSSDDSISVGISVGRGQITDAIQTLTELLHIRTEQLEEKDLPTHVDEKVEEYR